MRGIMEFDDYNYAIHNPYVLVEDPTKVGDGKTLPKSGSEESLINLSKTIKSAKNGEPTELKLSYRNLTNSGLELYKHDLVTV